MDEDWADFDDFATPSSAAADNDWDDFDEWASPQAPSVQEISEESTLAVSDQSVKDSENQTQHIGFGEGTAQLSTSEQSAQSPENVPDGPVGPDTTETGREDKSATNGRPPRKNGFDNSDSDDGFGSNATPIPESNSVENDPSCKSRCLDNDDAFEAKPVISESLVTSRANVGKDSDEFDDEFVSSIPTRADNFDDFDWDEGSKKDAQTVKENHLDDIGDTFTSVSSSSTPDATQDNFGVTSALIKPEESSSDPVPAKTSDSDDLGDSAFGTPTPTPSNGYSSNPSMTGGVDTTQTADTAAADSDSFGDSLAASSPKPADSDDFRDKVLSLPPKLIEGSDDFGDDSLSAYVPAKDTEAEDSNDFGEAFSSASEVSAVKPEDSDDFGDTVAPVQAGDPEEEDSDSFEAGFAKPVHTKDLDSTSFQTIRPTDSGDFGDAFVSVPVQPVSEDPDSFGDSFIPNVVRTEYSDEFDFAPPEKESRITASEHFDSGDDFAAKSGKSELVDDFGYESERSKVFQPTKSDFDDDFDDDLPSKKPESAQLIENGFSEFKASKPNKDELDDDFDEFDEPKPTAAKPVKRNSSNNFSDEFGASQKTDPAQPADDFDNDWGFDTPSTNNGAANDDDWDDFNDFGPATTTTPASDTNKVEEAVDDWDDFGTPAQQPQEQLQEPQQPEQPHPFFSSQQEQKLYLYQALISFTEFKPFGEPEFNSEFSKITLTLEHVLSQYIQEDSLDTGKPSSPSSQNDEVSLPSSGHPSPNQGHPSRVRHLGLSSSFNSGLTKKKIVNRFPFEETQIDRVLKKSLDAEVLAGKVETELAYDPKLQTRLRLISNNSLPALKPYARPATKRTERSDSVSSHGSETPDLTPAVPPQNPLHQTSFNHPHVSLKDSRGAASSASPSPPLSTSPSPSAVRKHTRNSFSPATSPLSVSPAASPKSEREAEFYETETTTATTPTPTAGDNTAVTITTTTPTPAMTTTPTIEPTQPQQPPVPTAQDPIVSEGEDVLENEYKKVKRQLRNVLKEEKLVKESRRKAETNYKGRNAFNGDKLKKELEKEKKTEKDVILRKAAHYKRFTELKEIIAAKSPKPSSTDSKQPTMLSPTPTEIFPPLSPAPETQMESLSIAPLPVQEDPPLGFDDPFGVSSPSPTNSPAPFDFSFDFTSFSTTASTQEPSPALVPFDFNFVPLMPTLEVDTSPIDESLLAPLPLSPPPAPDSSFLAPSPLPPAPNADFGDSSLFAPLPVSLAPVLVTPAEDFEFVAPAPVGANTAADDDETDGLASPPAIADGEENWDVVTPDPAAFPIAASLTPSSLPTFEPTPLVPFGNDQAPLQLSSSLEPMLQSSLEVTIPGDNSLPLSGGVVPLVPDSTNLLEKPLPVAEPMPFDWGAPASTSTLGSSLASSPVPSNDWVPTSLPIQDWGSAPESPAPYSDWASSIAPSTPVEDEWAPSFAAPNSTPSTTQTNASDDFDEWDETPSTCAEDMGDWDVPATSQPTDPTLSQDWRAMPADQFFATPFGQFPAGSPTEPGILSPVVQQKEPNPAVDYIVEDLVKRIPTDFSFFWQKPFVF